MKRMWINQPSETQPLHSYHGVKILTDLTPTFEGSECCKVYFTEGNVISANVPISCLSEGWPAGEPTGILEKYLKLMYVLDGAMVSRNHDNHGEERDWLRHCYNHCEKFNEDLFSKHLNGRKSSV